MAINFWRSLFLKLPEIYRCWSRIEGLQKPTVLSVCKQLEGQRIDGNAVVWLQTLLDGQELRRLSILGAVDCWVFETSMDHWSSLPLNLMHAGKFSIRLNINVFLSLVLKWSCCSTHLAQFTTWLKITSNFTGSWLLPVALSFVLRPQSDKKQINELYSSEIVIFQGDYYKAEISGTSTYILPNQFYKTRFFLNTLPLRTKNGKGSYPYFDVSG